MEVPKAETDIANNDRSADSIQRPLGRLPRLAPYRKRFTEHIIHEAQRGFTDTTTGYRIAGATAVYCDADHPSQTGRGAVKKMRWSRLFPSSEDLAQPPS